MGVVSSRHRRLETHSLVTGERRGHSVGTLRQGELVKGRRLQGPKSFTRQIKNPVGSKPGKMQSKRLFSF